MVFDLMLGDLQPQKKQIGVTVAAAVHRKTK